MRSSKWEHRAATPALLEFAGCGGGDCSGGDSGSGGEGYEDDNYDWGDDYFGDEDSWEEEDEGSDFSDYPIGNDNGDADPCMDGKREFPPTFQS